MSTVGRIVHFQGPIDMDSKKKDAKHAIEKKIKVIKNRKYGKYGTHPVNQNKPLMKDMEELVDVNCTRNYYRLYKMCKDDEDCLNVKKFAHDYDKNRKKKGHALHNAVLGVIRASYISFRVRKFLLTSPG